MLAVCLLLAPAAALQPRPYWFHPRIHNLGNEGLGGMAHALLAPLATHLIDRLAYDGHDVRTELVARHLADAPTAVDLCCGVGFSTRDVGVDTSPQMIEMARRIGGDQHEFHVGNAETWGEPDAYDAATLMFALHEMPAEGRAAVVANARRIATRKVVVVDIAPHYTPSPTMLAGEPFVLDYLANVTRELGPPTEVVAHTVAVWVLAPPK